MDADKYCRKTAKKKCIVRLGFSEKWQQIQIQILATNSKTIKKMNVLSNFLATNSKFEFVAIFLKSWIHDLKSISDARSCIL
jgi:hypothetical protein